ncbi:lipoprotein [Mesorhizobium sp.]|uniref:lipoprotein n=1 Tax=Mesorhizobium sp. TaxID=1871066 RepID=UPI000FE57796|nr:lipoprotein [Mesorhizobium sp.]RWK65095.1 MAG: hypothetical protein EOR49_05330 [Mesorhizobium sp.]RWM43251.1 MAG: hypothetical protein EOR76_30450 [Mesorhizobium sp.]RWM55562.1 MAG: hypothetical protein EOR78_13790 [Mesorhizobium sp.]RWM60930.1 MAG: hypothetical protein EOR79_05270 [Mesorhizobium sp.]RWN05306.1 MAG: hypothetical protein EOR85_01075 [Mesorhizobium sp.]
MKKTLSALVGLVALAGCSTTSGGTDAASTITSTIKGYRSCTVKTMAQNLSSLERVDIGATVDDACGDYMDKFGAELKKAGVKPAQVTLYQGQLRTTIMKYSTAAITAIMYEEYQKQQNANKKPS